MKPLKEFEVVRETKRGVQILRLIGPLDDYSLPRLLAALERLQQAGQVRVILDCYNLDYISSDAIRSLDDFIKLAREAQGDLILLRPAVKIRQIIKVLGYAREFQFFDKEDAAVNKLAPPDEAESKGAEEKK